MLGIILAADVVLILASQFGLGTNLLGRGSLSTVTPLLGVLILVSLAQGVVMGTGGIDLSIPATITLVGSIVLKASGGTDGGLGRAIVVVIVACVGSAWPTTPRATSSSILTPPSAARSRTCSPPSPRPGQQPRA